MNTVALMLAKKDSKRLKNKNWLDFKGKPMFQWNLEKCLKIFEKVYISSDFDYILNIANNLGATPIKRPLELCGDVPSIPVFQHAVSHIMVKPDIIIAVQANSPTLSRWLIEEAKELMEERLYKELMTCYPDLTINGSIWGLSKHRLENYEDPYKFTPEIILIDPSIDIHTSQDLIKANEQYDK